MIDIKTLPPLTRFCCTIGQLPASYLVSMSYEEQLLWLCNYLENTVIPTIDNNAAAVEELQELYITLKNYVDNYFDNLDVTEEINNKIESLVSDGTIQDLLLDYATVQKIYNTVSDMISDSSITANQKVKTLGYYSKNDGGGAEYVISDTSSNYYFQIETNNSLYAQMLVKNDTIDFRQLGAKANDSNYDSRTPLLNYVTLCNNLNKTLKLLIPNGNWYFTPTHICRIGGVNIEGFSGFPARGYFSCCFLPKNDNQDYILKFGGESNMNDTQLAYASTNTSNVMTNITFSTGTKKVNYGCLVLEYANYGTYKNIYFNTFIGTGLYIRSSWENYFDILNFRNKSGFDSPSLLFDTARSIVNVSANISSSSFDKVMFENCCGNLIQSNQSSNFLNNQFGEINIENAYKNLQSGEAMYNVTQDTDLSEMTPLYVFYGVGFDNTFNTINYTGLIARQNYWNALNNTNYYFQGIFGIPSSSDTIEGNIFNNIINNIFLRRNCTILTTDNIFTNAFKFNAGNIVASVKVTEKFKINNGCGQINVQNFAERDTTSALNNIHKKMLNSVNMYEYAINGGIHSDNTAFNDLGLVMGSPTIGTTLTNNALYYPFDYSETEKKIFMMRCKGSGNFTVRGQVNGANSNKVYTLEDVEGWQNIKIEMNYDAFCPIMLISSSDNIYFDTLSFVGSEEI